MTESQENLLRKTLDTIDRLERRRKWITVIAIVLVAVGCGYIALAMIYLRDMYLLYIATFCGLVLWMSGLAAGIIVVTNRNTQLILRALALNTRASENPSDTRPGSQS